MCNINKVTRVVFKATFLTIFGITLLSGCGRIQQTQTAQDQGVTLNLIIDSDDLEVGPTRLKFNLLDDQGQPIDGATLDVEGNMTHAGMVPVFAQSNESENGQYSIPFEWTMSGDWIVTVDVSLPDGKQFSWETPVAVQ